MRPETIPIVYTMSRWVKQALLFLVLSLAQVAFVPTAFSAVPEINRPAGELPELDEVEWLVRKPGAGVIFTVRDYDEEALVWLGERINFYLEWIRKVHPDLPIAFMSHGDELAALKKPVEPNYAELHKQIKHWIKKHRVTFHICGAMADRLGLSAEQFPDYIDVVDYGPSQVGDYLAIGYTHIELELTW